MHAVALRDRSAVLVDSHFLVVLMRRVYLAMAANIVSQLVRDLRQRAVVGVRRFYEFAFYASQFRDPLADLLFGDCVFKLPLLV